MNRLSNFFGGIQLLEERDSPHNGKLSVVRNVAWGTYIQAGGLTQSGGIVESIWKDVFKSLPKDNISKVLILGLGGGTIAKLGHKKWSEAKITGVDIDPIMVDLGKKYLGLKEGKTEIIISDAFEYCQKQDSKKKKFDLIFVDLYQGDKFPEKFETDNFIHLVRRLLAREGLVMFNRLYGGSRRGDAVRFREKLERIFKEVDLIYPEANIVMVCSK